MIKTAVIGASAESLHSIKEAQKQGIYVVALDGNEKAEGLAAADKGLHVNISDEKAVLQALEKEQVSFVLTVPIGRYLSTIGTVNDAFGLKGISRQAAVLCTDKFAFHTALEKYGLRDCHCYLVPGIADTVQDGVWEAGKPLKYPAILKPRYGSGSRGIFFLDNEQMLEAALTQIAEDREDYVLEEAVAGTEYGVDAAVTEDGFSLILLRKKLLTLPPARQAVGYLAVDPNQESQLFAAVKSYLEKIVQVLELKDCLMHADLMVQKVQESVQVFVIELSARPSGHNLHNLFTPLAAGVDMAREYVKYQTGQPYCLQPGQTKTMMIRYFDFEDCTVTRVPALEELQVPEDIRIVVWQCNIRPGDRMEKVTTGHSVMGRGYFVLEGKNEKALTEGAQKLLCQFERE